MRTLLVGAAIAASVAIPWAGAANAQDGTPSPAPTAVGTPWPAPRGLEISIEADLLYPDGSFIHPDARETTIAVTWEGEAGFSGAFEIERSLEPWARERQPFERVATIAAPDQRYEEHFSGLFDHSTIRCYRVRTVVNGETGPYSEEACTERPPTDGPATGPGPLAMPRIIVILQTVNILAPDGSFVSPADRSWTIHISWEPQPGFAGVYEIERVLTPPGGERGEFELVATQPPDGDGPENFSDTFPFFESETNRCYRIRAVLDGEAGPYSGEICWQRAIDRHVPETVPTVGMIVSRPSDDEAMATVHWVNPSGFTGTYEVLRATGPSYQALGPFEVVATVAAGQLHYQERFPAAEEHTGVRCYRLRVLSVDGPARPLSEPACVVPPPHSGGTPPPPPLPPDVGSGAGRPPSSGDGLALATGTAIAAMLLIAAGIVARSRRES